MDEFCEQVLVVEGKTDKEQLQRILAEPVEIACTYGTLSYRRLEQLLSQLQGKDVYLFVDADDSGAKVRKLFNSEFPNVHHLYTQKMYRQVATTPLEYLAQILQKAHFIIKDEFLQPE